ncbi:DnaJ subfamily B member like [Quillaja saponaria]|uniref:DnaJ subfamily B member like n=1 Tax=Quillaja saponaria TaxID=32244 RepID=A0AAD7LY66_QUISA|nr:DnaJ subfamily B member like [Quillaja saponaria]
MVDGVASLRNFCKAYKSIIKKWSSSKKSSPSQPQVIVEAEPNFENQEEAHDQGRDDQEEVTMNGIHSFRFNGSSMGGNDPASPRGLYRHRSVDNCFTSMPSLSRNASNRRSNTPTPSRVYRSTSRRSTDNSSRPPSPLLSRNVSRRSTTPIMFSNSSGMLKPPAIERKLECTLEELCYGCTKKIKITRDVVTNTGQIVQEEEMLTIDVKPGWKKGTKITFEGKGNERPGSYPADITFVIAEKRHHLFRRDSDDLELAVEIPLRKALTGCTISVPTLGGERKSLKIEEIIYPGYEKLISGQGMPVSKEKGKRGNLKITFLVEFPKQLTDDQRSEVVSILHLVDQ